MNKYDLKSTSIEDLLDEVEQMEQSGDHDRARMASISIHILKRTGKKVSTLLDARDGEKALRQEEMLEFKANSQYPEGHDKLWSAVFRKDRHVGLMDGMAVKLSGTAAEAMEQAEARAEEYNMILQCLSRRY